MVSCLFSPYYKCVSHPLILASLALFTRGTCTVYIFAINSYSACHFDLDLCPGRCGTIFIMPPTLKMFVGHIGSGLSVHPSVPSSHFFMPHLTFEPCMLGS